MKKLLYLLSFVLLPFISNASHLLGGEITWRCLPNGQYIFSMTVYRDCSGIAWNFQNETIDILGNALPTNGASGPVVSSIAVRPDRVRFQNSNNGDLSPSCTPVVDSSYSCGNRDQGSVQMFTYISNPVNLTGTPPTTGWKFYWEGPCCRPADLRNVNTTNINGSMLLRAVMYPLPGGLRADPCLDSSPSFRALPATLICRGSEFTYNYTALDEDFDSLVYSWDRPYDPPQSNPTALTYKPGFSFNNPTPDQNQNSSNIPASLDPLNGLSLMAVYSGTGIEKYLTVVKVDAYRSGQKISTIFREIPIAIFDCADLPGSPGVQNNPPKVKLNGMPANSIVITATAGQTVKVPVEVIDNDRTNVAPFQQELTLIPDGLLFTRSKTGPSKGFPADLNGEPCIISNKDVHPCAYLRGNPAPFVDQTATPPVTVIQGLGVINTEFVWQTSCNHVDRRTGMPGTNEGVHNFVLRVQDDHCPIPGINYPTITVRVKDPIPLEAPIVKGVSVNLDGTTTYSWVAPIDSVNQFNAANQSNDHYESTSSTPLDNQPPGSWASRNNNIQNYQQDKRDSDFSPYNFNNLADPSLGFNILESKDSHRGIFSDYYVRMRTLSGCTDTNSSAWSEPARIMELAATPGGTSNPRGAVGLDWNRAKPLNAVTYPYFVYESPTHYYIYANDSISNGGVADSANWYFVGDTNATTFNTSAGNCFDYSAFRVEARDTVVTYKAGSSLNGTLDTLYFSTFSTVDSLFITGGAPRVLNIQNSNLQASIERKNYQWIDCATNVALPGDTLKTYVPSVPGFYKVVTVNLNCVDTSSCFEVTPIEDTIYTLNYDYLKLNSNGNVINWIDCADSSIVSGANATYIPTKPGNYAALVGKFGFEEYSDCFTTIVLSDSVILYTNDSLRANMSGMSYQWIDCSTNMPITGATSQNFKPQDTGYYKVVISAYGYSDTSRCVPVFAIAIEEESLSEGISYYPNPTNGLVNINLKSEAVNLTVVVRNIQGQLVQEQQFRNKANLELEIEGKAGIYFIQLTNEKGDRANLKVVKQ